MSTLAGRQMRQGWASVLNAGIATFLGAPYVEPNRKVLQEAGAKAAVIGMPFDSTTIARSGAMMGPRAVRDASSHLLSYHGEYDVDLFETLGLVDCGDVPVVPANAQVTMDRCAGLVGEILMAGAIPAVIGGDHSITIGGTWGVDRHRQGRYGYIMFDTHLDTAVEIGGERLNHCCPVPRAMELDSFDPANCVIIGPHGAMNPRAEYDYVREHGIKVFTVKDVMRMGPEQVAGEALAIAARGTDGFYLSVDMDCLDSSCAPGTCVPTMGGLTNRELLMMLDRIGRGPLVAMDVVEIAPQYDTGITALGACQVLVDTLAAYAASHR